MCGISCCLYKSMSSNYMSGSLECINNFNKALTSRGPDLFSEIKTDLFADWIGIFSGYTLWMQGPHPVSQPIWDEEGNLLLWNGDVLSGPLDNDELCDTENVFVHFKQKFKVVIESISNICGPYSFIFWDNENKCLWFGRDVFGRHSLLWSIRDDEIVITSVGHKNCNLQEVPASGIFMIDFSQTSQIELEFFPWSHLSNLEIDLNSKVKIKYKLAINHFILGNGISQSDWFGKEPLEDEISMFKVFSKDTDPSVIFESLLKNHEIKSRTSTFLNLLLKSVEVRVKKQPNRCKKCLKKNSCDHSSVSLLFSGGLDSTVLAVLCDIFVPKNQSIDLYNVAFEPLTKNNVGFNVPDRITGETSLLELKNLAPHRVWNFVKIDVTREELESCRNHTIKNLIYPLDSVLDDSLGCALWFAAKGDGVLNGNPYTSPARISILGMGADEQLGGYMRHRMAFRKTSSWSEIGHQLCLDINAISRRNLGRDNRVVSDHGRQPRLPYLDEHVVSYLYSLPPWHRCILIPEMPPGVGDKMLLRLVAWKLGLRFSACLPKRALQFGSRIASSKEKGDYVCNRLL
uniref:Asparagine synthetase domain-containing protein n=4 Tax=Clastoptera arizonana TaxID=38151 RepID=A0A1B6D251_9HEMI